MKRTNRYMEIILKTFPKKLSFVANGSFKTQNGASSNSEPTVKAVLKF